MAVLAAAVFCFWAFAYPHALSFQEQYQMFLFTGDYLMQRIKLPGGLADYLGEFLTQFYYIPWLGALFLAILFVAIQKLTWRVIDTMSARPSQALQPVAMTVPALLLWLMGDENALLSYPMALVLAMVAYLCVQHGEDKATLRVAAKSVVVVPLAYWFAGPAAWLTVMLLVIRYGWRMLHTVLVMSAMLAVAYCWWVPQAPPHDVLLGINYYRIPLQTPQLMLVIPAVIAMLALMQRFGAKAYDGKARYAVAAVGAAIVLALAVLAVNKGYDSDKYELIRQDYLVRNERWADIIDRAGEKTVKTPFWCNSVNLALAQQRMLADRMFDFWQSGPDALIMPMYRDMTSDIISAEAFWHLAMVNSAQRYMSDMQESILNGRRSGRMTKRIAECYIVNGKYDLAKKHLMPLTHTLFYSSWAKDALALNDAKVAAHPLYGKLKMRRFREDFLFSYPELEKIFARLFVNNKDNKMALDYFIGMLLLKGDIQTFAQALQLAQQYGGYTSMPLGYQDAVNCIRNHNALGDTPYANYIKQMMQNSTPTPNTQTNESAH